MSAPASFKSKLAESGEEDMDMTPMVDVTFLLLIFFMITAAFALQKAMEVPPVDDDEAAPTEVIQDPEKDIVVVRLDADNVYWVTAPIYDEEEKAVSRRDMRELVRRGREGEGTKGPSKMLIQSHGDATHEYMVAAIDAGAEVEMQEIRLKIYEDGEL
ncbi:MAG: biopolymer transporter ExbD [Planctomycetota bacterium]